MLNTRLGMRCVALVGAIGLASCTTPKTVQNELANSVRAAEATVLRMQSDSRHAVFSDNMKNAKAIVIFSPGNARGVVLARTAGVQGWSGPAFYNFVTLDASSGRMGTTGLRAGKQNLEVVLLAMSDQAMTWIMSPRLPGTHGLAVFSVTQALARGPRGVADVIVFARKQNGEDVELVGGPIISIDNAANQSYYGRVATPADILLQRNVSSLEAVQLQNALRMTK